MHEVSLNMIYEGRLESNEHMLVEHEQTQITKSRKTYIKVQLLATESYLFFNKSL